MTPEHRDAAPAANVLTYATPQKRMAWKPPPAWLKLAVVAASLPILAMFLLSLPPLAGAVDYTRDIPLAEIVAYARDTGVRGTLHSRGMIYTATFAPAALVCLAAFLLVRGLALQRVVVGANVALPAFWLALIWPIMAALGPPTLLTAAAGRCDGETWSEGYVCYAAMGSWTALWVAVSLSLVVVRLFRDRTASAAAVPNPVTSAIPSE